MAVMSNFPPVASFDLHRMGGIVVKKVRDRLKLTTGEKKVTLFEMG
jgi:hypothetical protein